MREVTCIECGVIFNAIRPTRKFCSHKCTQRFHIPLKGRKKGKFEPCVYCGIQIWSMPHKGKKYKMRFCSKEHLHLYQKKNSFNFPCFICSKPIFTQPAQLKFRARSTCSAPCRQELRRRRTEENRAKIGITKFQLDRRLRYSKEAENWRKAIFARDNYTCQFCHVRGGYIEADHIKPWAYFPALRFELSNGRTLCRPCHDTTKISYKKMREIYGVETKEVMGIK